MFSEDELKVKLAILEEKCRGRFSMEESTHTKLNEALDKISESIEKLSIVEAQLALKLEDCQERLRKNDLEHQQLDGKISALLPLKFGAILAKGIMAGLIATLVFSVSNMPQVLQIIEYIQEALPRQEKLTKV